MSRAIHSAWSWVYGAVPVMALTVLTALTSTPAHSAERSRLLRYENEKRVTASSCSSKSYLGGLISGGSCSSESDPAGKASEQVKAEANKKLREACEKPATAGIEGGRLRADPTLLKGDCRTIHSENKIEVSCKAEYVATCVTGAPDAAAVRDPKVNDSRSISRAPRILVDKETGIRYRIDEAGNATEIDESAGTAASGSVEAAAAK